MGRSEVKLRRLWIVSPAPWTKGGVATVTRLLAGSSLRTRYDLRVVATYASGSAWTRTLWALRGAIAVAWGLLTRRPDVVHVKVASRGSFFRKLAVTALCRLAGVPVVVHVHGGGFDAFIEGSAPWVHAAAKWMIEEAPKAITLSEARRARLEPLFPRARWTVVPNPVDAAAFRSLAAERRAARGAQAEPSPQLLFLGDVLERKGIGELLQSLSDLPSALAAVRLVVAGSGEIDRYRRLAAELGLTARVRFAGWVGEEKRRALLLASDAFILPSYVEGVPLALLEAMASGLPSVVTPVGGVLDAAVPDETCLVVPPGDAAALRQALVRLLTEPGLAERLGERAQERARDFDVEVVAGQLDAIYRAVLEPLPGRAAWPA